jgi:hypothetical protein
MDWNLRFIFVDWGLRFIIGLCLIVFIGALIYRAWYTRFYRKPILSRTEVSLQIDEKTIYLPHIVSITEEYTYSVFLIVCGFALGFMTYLLCFLFLDFRTQGFTENVILSVVLATIGGASGYILGLSKKTVIHDSSGASHVLHLRDIETIEFTRELTKDLWDFYRKLVNM